MSSSSESEAEEVTKEEGEHVGEEPSSSAVDAAVEVKNFDQLVGPVSHLILC